MDATDPSTAAGPPARQWRSIFISDIHLGTRHAQVDALLEFLRQNESQYLYLVGDVIDGWELKRAWRWEPSYNTLIQKVLRRHRKGAEVVYVTGNHDEFLEEFFGHEFGGLRLVRELVHVGADGRRYLVVHGHQFDGLTHFNRLLEKLGSRLYDWVLEANLWANRLRRRLGLGYWSFARYLKSRAKQTVKYVTEYETAMAGLADQHGVDGIICGHIHQAEIRQIGRLTYLNCGDWVESCTALVEDFSGTLSLVHFHEIAVHGAGGGARASDPSPGGLPELVPAGA
ncbi:MAG: UDP-2,3-diacylglucosamine diphosphatase [Gemmatimonadales bacterium]